MSLTHITERDLKDAGLVAFYDGNPKSWETLAQETYDFLKTHFPQSATIRRDDVSEALISYIKPDEKLDKFLKSKRLTQKYWYQRFADLIIDRTWTTISAVKKG